MNKYQTGNCEPKSSCGEAGRQVQPALQGDPKPPGRSEAARPPRRCGRFWPQPRSTSSAAAPGGTMATAAASSESYASGNSAALPTAFNEANSSKAMASRADSAPALLRLLAFSWDQCTASATAPAPLRRPSGSALGSWAFHVAHVARAGLYRESCATNDERRETAPWAVAWVATGDSCGRPGGFSAFLARAKERALKRAPPIG